MSAEVGFSVAVPDEGAVESMSPFVDVDVVSTADVSVGVIGVDCDVVSVDDVVKPWVVVEVSDVTVGDWNEVCSSVARGVGVVEPATKAAVVVLLSIAVVSFDPCIVDSFGDSVDTNVVSSEVMEVGVAGDVTNV